MFNWLVTLFMLASLVILFAAWTRAIRAKDRVTAPQAQGEWGLLRIMVFIALVCEIVLLILALIGLSTTFAYLSGLFLAYFSVVFLYAISFFMIGLENLPASAPPTVNVSVGGSSGVAGEMRSHLHNLISEAETLRDQAGLSDEQKASASSVVLRARDLLGLVDRM